VAEQLKKLQNAHAELREVEGRAVQKGDCVFINGEGNIQGNPFPGSSLKNTFVEIASDSFLPGFSDHLIGLNKGAEKTFSIDIAEDYEREDLAGQRVEFKVIIKELKEKILHPIDDEFSKDCGDFKDLEDLKNRIRETLKQEQQQQIDTVIKEKIFDMLREQNPFESPPSMVESQVRSMVFDTQQRFAAQGLKIEDLDDAMATLSEKYKETAEKQVKAALLLEAIAKQENITAKDGEIDKKFQEIAQKIDKDLGTVKKNIDKEIIKAQILEEKALDLIRSKAKIKVK
jgi:trigger factor